MQEINHDKNIRLCYFMASTNKGVGYICMALQRPEKGSISNTYRAGFSFCSPQEGKKFSKKKARAMAVGRLTTFSRNKTDRIEFTSNAKNLTDVFSEGFANAEQVKIISIVKDPSSGKEITVSKWFVPNWVRNRKELLFGLNVNGSKSEDSGQEYHKLA